MAATITPPIDSLIARLRVDYPAIHFYPDDTFHWSPSTKTVFFAKQSANSAETLLHELAHAILKHQTHQTDIELIRQERAAWQYARSTLAPIYQINITNDLVESDLDTYRTWLHARSICPHCQAIGLQVGPLLYHCIVCKHTWKVNQAKQCELRRHDLTKNSPN